MSGSVDQTVKFWGVERKTMTASFSEHSNLVSAVAFSPDGKLAASTSFDQTVILWSTADDSQATTTDFSASFYKLRSVSFSPDGTTIAAGVWAPVLAPAFLLDAKTGARIKSLMQHGASVESVSFSPDGRLLATGSEVGLLRIYDLEKDECIAVFNVEEGQSSGFLSNLLQRTMDFTSEHPSDIWKDVRSVTFSPDGRFLAAGCDDATVKLVDVKTLQIVRTFDKAKTRIASVEFSPDGRFLAVAGKNPQPILWEIDTDRVITLPPEHPRSVCSISFNHDGSLLATSDQAGLIKIWDLDRLESRLTLYAHFGSVETVSFSPDGAILASGSSDTSIKLWDVETGE